MQQFARRGARKEPRWRFRCGPPVGIVTADGEQEIPCPYCPNWPRVEEFDFRSEQHGAIWLRYPIGKTARARKVHILSEHGMTQEEAESKVKSAVAPKKDKYYY